METTTFKMVEKLLQKKMLSLRFSGGGGGGGEFFEEQKILIASAVQSCHCKFKVDLGIPVTVTAVERGLNHAKCFDKHHFWLCKSQYLEAFDNLMELTSGLRLT